MTPEEERIALGKRVVWLRAERCLSQKQLCLRAGISQRTMSDIETGRKNPRTSTLGLIAKALDVPLARLLGL